MNPPKTSADPQTTSLTPVQRELIRQHAQSLLENPQKLLPEALQWAKNVTEKT